MKDRVMDIRTSPIAVKTLLFSSQAYFGYYWLCHQTIAKCCLYGLPQDFRRFGVFREAEVDAGLQLIPEKVAS